MRIFGCFTFCDEKILTELRLNILNKNVDFFVVVESNFYYNGSPKRFDFNVNNFLDFKNKILSYNHQLDQSQKNYNSRIKLEKVGNEFFSEYLANNTSKYI